MTMTDPPAAMTTCPFCAEDIKEAAVVCRYCGSDLGGRPRGRNRLQTLLLAWIALVVTGAAVNTITVLPWTRRAEFDRRRDAWLTRCASFDTRPPVSPRDFELAAECFRELESLNALAERRGYRRGQGGANQPGGRQPMPQQPATPPGAGQTIPPPGAPMPPPNGAAQGGETAVPTTP